MSAENNINAPTTEVAAGTKTVIPAIDLIHREECVALEAYKAISGVVGGTATLALTTSVSGTTATTTAGVPPPIVHTCQPPPGFAYGIDDETLLTFDSYWDAHKRLGEVKLADDHSQDLYFRSAEVPVRDPMTFERKTFEPRAIVQGVYTNTISGSSGRGATQNDGETATSASTATNNVNSRKGRSLAATRKLRVGETIAMDTSVLVSVNEAAIYKFPPKKAAKNASDNSNLFSASSSATSTNPMLWKCCQHMIRKATMDTLDGHALLVESSIVPMLCSMLLTMGDDVLEPKMVVTKKNKKKRNPLNHKYDGNDDEAILEEKLVEEYLLSQARSNGAVGASSNSVRAQLLIDEIILDYCRHEFLEKVEEEADENKVEEGEDKNKPTSEAIEDNIPSSSAPHLAFKSQPPPKFTTIPSVDSLNLSHKEKEVLLLAKMAIKCIPSSLLRVQKETVEVALPPKAEDEEEEGEDNSCEEETQSGSTKTVVMVENAPISGADATNNDDGKTYRAPLYVTETNNKNKKKKKITIRRYAFFARLGLDDPFKMAKFIAALRSNCMGITSCPDLPASRTALFPFIRFAEHECRPNASVTFIDSPASHFHGGVAGRHNYNSAEREEKARAEREGGGDEDRNDKKKSSKKKNDNDNAHSAECIPTYALEGKDIISVDVTEHAWRPAVAVLTAIREIQPGEAITIAYLPTAYSPWKQRQEELRARYNFTCRCRWCASSTSSSASTSTTSMAEPDLARGFRCSKCALNMGVVCPVGDGSRITEWCCLQCGYHPTEDEINRMLDHEKRLATTKADKHVGLTKLLSDPYVHYTHAIVFKKLDEWSEKAWREQDANMCLEYIEVLKKCVSRVLEEGDPSKAQLYEFAGQVQHALGNAHTARYEYFLAYQHRVRCGQRFTHWCRLTGYMSNVKSLVDLLDSK